MKSILLILLFSMNANATIDESARDILKWDNTTLARQMSDVGLYTSYLAPTLVFIEGENKLKRVGGFLAAHSTVGFLSAATKAWSKRMRPNNSDNKSFFSGHTSGAFTTAGYLCAYESEDACQIGLAVAALTGYLRIAANRHWLTDVTVGAIIGYSGGYVIPTIIIEL